MLESALLWHRKFRGDLELIGFVFNAHDACMANRSVNGKTHTVRFHVNNLMSSHMDEKVNNEFLMWLNQQVWRMCINWWTVPNCRAAGSPLTVQRKRKCLEI